MPDVAHFRQRAATLRELADCAPAWRHRNELLEIAREYDGLAAVAAARESGRAMPAEAALPMPHAAKVFRRIALVLLVPTTVLLGWILWQAYQEREEWSKEFRSYVNRR